MIAFYAMGGGWGHLTRVKAFIRSYQIPAPFLIITSNQAAFDLFEEKEIVFIPPTESAQDLSKLIDQVFKNNPISECYIDTFPYGILSELSANLFQSIKVNLLARRIIWNRYTLPDKPAIPFNKVYLFEEPEPEQLTFLQQHSNNLTDAHLEFPTPDQTKAIPPITNRPIWLIVHTSKQEEIELLLDHAKDIADIADVPAHFVVLTDQKIKDADGVTILRDQYSGDWFPIADKIFTGGGFNTLYQLRPYCEKHVGLPFERRFDDQFWRVKQFRNGVW